MNFGKLKRGLQALINRKDFTDELAGDFIGRAIGDLECVLRIGSMEVVATQSSWDGTRNAIIIPSNYLETLNLFTDDGELTQVDLAEFFRLDAAGNIPTHFVKIGDRWLVKPTPAVGSKVYLHYYAESDPLAADSDQNIWTLTAFNAVLYTAAGLAADFFQMEDVFAGRFASKADKYVGEIQSQDLDEKWSGRLAVPPPADIGPF